jgi:outer membrane protein assembly factor BamB
MSKVPDLIYIGVRGSVLALDRSTGVEIWRTELKGLDFVNVVLDGDKILATTKGILYCLDSDSGQVQWTNELRGLGRGLVTVATANSQLGSVVPSAEKKRRDQEAAAAASTAAIASS